MTPQEKSIKLIDQYRLILIHSETDAGEEILCTTIAKQCALVAVDEILNQDAAAFDVTEREYHFGYWQNVKQELEKL